MSSILRDQPPPLSEVRPDLPRHLGRILRRCLEKDPRDRYQSARSICNELRSLRIETTDAGSASSADGRRVQLYERPWILVTGFKVSGTDPEMGDFAEGLAEDITAGLSRFGYLSVVARESALTGSDRSVGEMRDGVGARYLIEGSVRKAGSIVRVGVRLVDSRTGAHLWAETYTRDMSALDIFSVQDDITGRVVATVADGYGVLVRSMIDAIETKPAEELNASEWVLRMFDYLLQYTAEGHAALRDGIEQAVKRYPRDSDVWAVLAQVYLNEWNFGFDPKHDSLDRALAAAEKAVDLDRTNPLAYQLLAQVHFFRRDLIRFRAASDRAIGLNPLDTNTVGVLGLITAHTGEFERGAELTRKAMDLNPHHAGWYHFGLIWLHFSRGEYEQALERVSHVNMPGMFWTYLAMAAICGQLGRKTEGREAVRKLLEIDPEFAAHARHNIESWHFASGLMEPLLEGLRKAGLAVSGDDAAQPAEQTADTAATTASGAASGSPVPVEAKRPADATVAIAVLPFKDMSPGKDQEYLCEGMAEEVMSGLGQIAGIRVASRTSAFRAGQEGKDLPAIGRALHVGHVLEGSVRTAGDRLRVTAQLIDVESGYQLWSERYDRDASDIFALQDEIAQSVVEVVKAKLSTGTGGVRQRQQVSNLDAYRHYLKGRYYRYTKNDHGSALEEYERAIELDPSYAPSWVGLAEVRVLAAGYGLIPAQRGYAEARDALARANDRQGESAEALYVEGMLEMSQRNWEAALSALSRAAELRPDHVQTLCWLGFYWSIMQRPTEARRWFDLAREVDPLGSYPFAMTGCGLSQMCRFEEALEFLKQAVALDPENTLALWGSGMVMAGQGNAEEGIPLLERAVEKARRGAHILGVLGWGFALAGRRSEAEAVLAELNAKGAEAPAVVPKAWLLAALGDTEAAWQAMEQAERQCQMMLLFVGMPGLDPLRSDPRFDALLRRMVMLLHRRRHDRTPGRRRCLPVTRLPCRARIRLPARPCPGRWPCCLSPISPVTRNRSSSSPACTMLSSTNSRVSAH
jgi:TolB-like protein/Tfp pilus assembly protein PilF